MDPALLDALRAALAQVDPADADARVHLRRELAAILAGDEGPAVETTRDVQVRDEGVAVRRQPGGWEGRMRISEDFDAPLPLEIEGAFEGLLKKEPRP
jgi:hypothetical protein